ncbi:tetratricopeptide repeat protein [Candidatus Campbellbacteria bacterium]|nr:MAG: tetratricopeptide repeat protein [Candidatus Campbellbacteria bacterium]
MINFFNKKFKDDKTADAYERGISYQRAGDYKAAIQKLLEAVNDDPAFVEAYNSLGLTFKKMGDFDNAIKYYNLGIEAYFQTIYDEIKMKPVREVSNRYASTHSETWMDVATQIAIKNSARDGIKNAKFPTGENALKMSGQNYIAGQAFHDEKDTRYILPAYFSAVYEALKSSILYSILVNNAGTVFAEEGDKVQAAKCFKESMEFIPDGAEYNDPMLGLQELGSTTDYDSGEKSFVAKLTERLEKFADSKGKIICSKCGETAPFFGMRGHCLNCNESFDNSRRADQLLVALEYLYTFIDECDESLHIHKDAVLNALANFQKKINDSQIYPEESDMDSLRHLIRDLGQIGGNKCGGAIDIPKDGKFGIHLLQKDGMVSKDAAELLSPVLLSIMFITKTYN